MWYAVVNSNRYSSQSLVQLREKVLYKLFKFVVHLVEAQVIKKVN